jgi:hypothetical protein
MHNIKVGHDVKASVSDMFINYAEAFKKTKIAEAKNKNKKLFVQIQNAGKNKLSVSHNIRLCIHFNGICPQAFQLLNPIFSNLSGRF